jgi:NAD-dependent SIR2 family protein deacetylase
MDEHVRAVGDALAGATSTAPRHGAGVVIVSDEETPDDDVADYSLRGDVTEVLAALRDAVFE